MGLLQKSTKSIQLGAGEIDFALSQFIQGRHVPKLTPTFIPTCTHRHTTCFSHKPGPLCILFCLSVSCHQACIKYPTAKDRKAVHSVFVEGENERLNESLNEWG